MKARFLLRFFRCESRVWLALASGVLATACPVYPPGDCLDNRDGCGEGRTCDLRSGRCVRVISGSPAGARCLSPSDCEEAETCGEEGRCVPGSCAIHGCVEGFECTIVEDSHWCLDPDAGPGQSVDSGEIPAVARPDANATVTLDAGDASAEL